MDLTNAELELVRQWFNAVQDANPAYLGADDYILARQIYEMLRIRVPDSMKGKTR
jgi:hypothetical protein